MNEQEPASPYSPTQEWLTPREAADYMGVNVRSIYTWIGRGELEATKDNRSVRINRASLEVLQQRKHIRKVAGEVVEELAPRGGERKREVSSAVFVALAGLQKERQQLMQQLGELQLKVSHDAYNLGQMEQKLQMIAELEDLIVFLRKEGEGVKQTNKRLLNLMTVMGILLILIAFMLLICLFVLIRN